MVIRDVRFGLGLILAVASGTFACAKKTSSSSRGSSPSSAVATSSPTAGSPAPASSLPPAGATVSGTALPPVLVTFSASGAEVGKSGMMRFVFSGNLPAEGSVTLVSSDPAVASVPGVVKVPAGASTVDVAFGGQEHGNTIVTASFGDVTLDNAIQVVPAFKLAQDYNATQKIEVGAKVGATFRLNAVTPAAVDIPIVVDGSAVAAAASAHVAPFSETSEPLIATGAAPGAASLTASYGGETYRNDVTVVDHASVNSITIPALVEKGAPVKIQVAVDALVAKTTTVTLASSSPATIALPANIPLAAGSTFGEVTVPALAAGQATITATLGATTQTATLTVVDAPTVSSLSLTGTMQVRDTTELRVTLGEVAATAHLVTLTSSAPGILPVPASVTIPAGETSASVSVTAAATGQATITGSLGSAAVSTSVVVGPVTPRLSIDDLAISLAVAASTPVYVSVSGTNEPAVLAVQSSDPTVVGVPSTIPVQYGSASILVQALKTGTATITATWAGLSQTVAVTVVDAPAIGAFGPSFQVSIGKPLPISLQLNATPAGNQQVTFTSSDPTIVVAPPPVPTSPGSTYMRLPPLIGLASGTALLTATLGSSSATAVVYVDAANTAYNYPQFLNCGDTTLQVGAITTAEFSMVQTATADLPVAVAYAPNGIVKVIGSPTVKFGETQAQFPVQAVAAGTSTLTATVGGIQETCNYTVVTTPTYLLTVPATIATGATVVATVATTALLPSDVSVALASANKSLVTVSTPSVTLGPGIQSAMFGVTGVAVGSTAITATVGAVTKSANVTVSP